MKERIEVAIFLITPGIIIAVLLAMSKLFKLLFLLMFLCSFDAFAQTCSDLLTRPDYSSYNFSLIRRPNQDISDNQKSRDFLKKLDQERAIIPSTNSPYSRTQYYGTCYAYASICILENALIQNRLIESGDLVLAPSIMMQIAQSRITTEENSIPFRELLDRGDIEVFHALHGNSIFYLPKSEIKKLGTLKKSSNFVLDFEHDFLSKIFDFLDQFGPPYNLSSNDPKMIEVINNTFIDSLSKHTIDDGLQSLNHQTIGPISIEYEFRALMYTGNQNRDYFISQSNINTNEHTTVSKAKEHLKKNFLTRFVGGNFFDNESIRMIVQQLQNNNFILVALKKGIFGDAHAITLTNLVINPENKTIMGFVFLDSNHRTSGLLGYRFISVRELKENMSFLAFIKNLDIIDN